MQRFKPRESVHRASSNGRRKRPSADGRYTLAPSSLTSNMDNNSELSRLRDRHELLDRYRRKDEERLRERQQKKLLQQAQRRQQPQRRQRPKNPSDDYLLSNEDEDLYAARMKYLKERRLPGQSREYRKPPKVPGVPTQSHALINYANSGQSRKGQRTIVSYNQEEQAPTKDLQTLVLVLVREQLRDEVLHLSEIANDQNPFEMRNMRLNSFIANTPDLMDHWKVVMLEEGMRIIDESFDLDSLDWVAPGCGADRKFPMPIDEQTLVSLPADKPEISKSQVATEYIQAQRGHQTHGQEDSLTQMFQSELLKAENAASAPVELFEKISTCYKPILQKAAEIEYIEGKPETCQAVAAFVEQLKANVESVVQDALTQSLVDAREQGGIFLRVLIGKIMEDLHASHAERNFEPMRLQIVAQRQD